MKLLLVIAFTKLLLTLVFAIIFYKVMFKHSTEKDIENPLSVNSLNYNRPKVLIDYDKSFVADDRFFYKKNKGMIYQKGDYSGWKQLIKNNTVYKLIGHTTKKSS